MLGFSKMLVVVLELEYTHTHIIITLLHYSVVDLYDN